MTKEEAQKILDIRDKLQDSSCSCHMGNPPCGYCENMPSADMIDEAEQVSLRADEINLHNIIEENKILKINIEALRANQRVEAETIQILVDLLISEGYTVKEIYEHVATRIK